MPLAAGTPLPPARPPWPSAAACRCPRCCWRWPAPRWPSAPSQVGAGPRGDPAGPGPPRRSPGLSRGAALSAEKQRACLLPPDEGPCRALVPRWYYDRHTQSCQQFTYGGCYGNANNFLTFDDCEKSCWTIKSESSAPEDPGVAGGWRGHRGGSLALRDALHPPDTS